MLGFKLKNMICTLLAPLFKKITSLELAFLLTFGAFPSILNAQGLSSFDKPKVIEPCSVFWNGREFKKGSTKGNSDFKRLSYSYFGVEAVVVSLPNGMAKEFGVDSVEVGKEISPSKKFENFMGSQWGDISKLCKLEKLK
jgi:hypothetical protein